jgi:DNA-directed RNA polymerase subunit M/transcription elongation factor TFIIS
MPLFCSTCNNLLLQITTADEFHFKCAKCETIEEPTDKDSLRYEDVKGTNLTVYREILLTSGKDSVNPIVEKTCKCGHNRVRQVRLGQEMKLINTCIKCNEQWLESMSDD